MAVVSTSIIFTVLDKDTNEPIRGALVNVEGNTNTTGRAGTALVAVQAHTPFTISVKHDDYKTYRDEYEPTTGTNRITVKLKPNADLPPLDGPARITFEGTPYRAKVYRGSTLLGRLPFEVELGVGRHTITAKASGYEDFSKRYTFSAGQKTTVRITMEKEEEPTPEPPSPLNAQLYAKLPNLNSSEKEKITKLSESDKEFFLNYLDEGWLIGEADVDRMGRISDAVYEAREFDFDKNRNEFIRDYGSLLADLSPSVAVAMSEIDPAWWNTYSAQMAQEAGMSIYDWQDDFLNNLAFNIGIEAGTIIIGADLFKFLGKLTGPVASKLKAFFMRLIPSSIMRNALVQSTRGSLRNPLAGTTAKVRGLWDDLLKKLGRAPKAAGAQAQIEAWQDIRDKAFKSLLKQKPLMSDDAYNAAHKVLEEKFAKGYDTIIRGLGSKIISGEIPWTTAMKGVPARVAHWLTRNKLAVIKTLGATAIGAFTLINFADFISEETAQSMGFAAKISLDTLRWSTPEMWEENRVIARETIDAYHEILDRVQKDGEFLRAGRPLTGAAFTAFFEAEQLKIETYENEYKNLVAKGPPTEPPIEPPEEFGTLDISSTPTDAKIYIDDDYTFEQTNTTLKLPVGTHILTLKAKDYNDLHSQFDIIQGETVEMYFAMTPEGEEPPPSPPPTPPPSPPPEPPEPTEKGTLMVSTGPGVVTIEIPGLGDVDTDEFGNAEFTLLPGHVEIKLKKEGFITERESIYIKSGETSMIRNNLEMGYEPPEEEEKLWRYDVSSTPSGAKILVDGAFTDKWTSGYVILYPNETYTISVEKSGYYPASITFTTDPID